MQYTRVQVKKAAIRDIITSPHETQEGFQFMVNEITVTAGEVSEVKCIAYCAKGVGKPCGFASGCRRPYGNGAGFCNAQNQKGVGNNSLGCFFPPSMNCTCTETSRRDIHAGRAMCNCDALLFMTAVRHGGTTLSTCEPLSVYSELLFRVYATHSQVYSTLSGVYSTWLAGCQ